MGSSGVSGQWDQGSPGASTAGPQPALHRWYQCRHATPHHCTHSPLFAQVATINTEFMLLKPTNRGFYRILYEFLATSCCFCIHMVRVGRYFPSSALCRMLFK